MDPLAVLHLDNQLFMNGSYIKIKMLTLFEPLGFMTLSFCNFFYQIVFVRSDNVLDKFKFEILLSLEFIFQPFKINRFLSIKWVVSNHCSGTTSAPRSLFIWKSVTYVLTLESRCWEVFFITYIRCCVLSKLKAIQLNFPCTLVVISSKLTPCYTQQVPSEKNKIHNHLMINTCIFLQH